MRKWNSPYSRGRKIVFSAVCLALIIAIISLLIDARIQPAVRELAALEARNIATKKINLAAESVIASSLDDCKNIITISYGDGKAVTGISADMIKLNLLKSRITAAIEDAFRSEPETVVRVPVGAAAELPVLPNQGPFKDVEVSYSVCVYSDFDNVFQSTGINQTEYSILLRLKVEILMLLPGASIKENVETSFCIAQTVIVGGVPRTADNIQNYGNGK